MKNILDNAELKKQIYLYKRYIKDIKKYEIVFLVFTVVLLLLSCVSLIFIYLNNDVHFNVEFIISTSVAGGFLLLFVPTSIVMYYKSVIKIQVHLPISFSSTAIDTSTLFIGVFNFISAITAAAAPIVLHEFHDEWAWEADQKIIIYISMCAIIYLLWGVLSPVFQDKILEKEEYLFSRYVLFEYEKIPEYVEYLREVYPKRVKEFNAELKRKEKKEKILFDFFFERDKILYTPIKENETFSYDTRRVFQKNIESKFGGEYDLIKYCAFIEIFKEIHNDIENDDKKRDHIKRIMRMKNKEMNFAFVEKIRKYI